MALSLGSLGKKLWDQINPLDNNRTWQQRAPTNNQSVGGQFMGNRLVQGASAAGERFGGSTVRQVARAPAAGMNVARYVVPAISPAFRGVVAPVVNRVSNNLNRNTESFVKNNLEDDLAITQGTPAARVGSKVGQGLNITRDLALMSLAGSAGEKAARASQLLKSAPAAVQRVAPVVANSLAGSAASTMRDKGAGMKVDPVREVGIGLAIDAATYGGGKYIKKGAKELPKVVAKVDDAAFTPRNMRVGPEVKAQLSDWADYKTKRYKPKADDIGKLDANARKLTKETGIDFVNGSAANIDARVASFLDPTTVKQGGYIAKPKVSLKGDKPESARLANQLDDIAYREAQAARETQYTQPLGQRITNTLKRELMDPRNVQQRLDDQEFKRLKKAGLIKKGQKELLPEQSLAALRGRIENPQRAAEVRNKQKYAAPSGEELSINDIIKKYGKENGQKARDFEQYRIYKDELTRIDKGAPNTLGLDPAIMQRYIAGYERINPAALEHNAVLRQASLDALAARKAAGIDNPELFDKLSQFDNYNPRQALDPEDLIRPGMTGGVRSGAKGTMARSETAGGVVRSPLSLFRDVNNQLERALAEQQYGLLLRDRAKAGSIPGAREVVNAEDVIVRKQLLSRAKEIAESLKKPATRGSNVRAELRNQNILKGGAEYRAAQRAKETLRAAVKDPDAQAVIGDLSRKDLLDVFETMVEGGEKNIERLRSNLVKRNNRVAALLNELDTIKTEVKAGRQEAASLRSGAAEFTSNLERGTQTYTYKIDGETGKIEIPNDLATELAKANELQNMSMVEKGLKPVATTQKLLWTGILQPAFKVWNVLVKNPLLAFRNADGLSGVRPEAVASIVRQVVNTPKMRTFINEMKSRGVAYENALQTRNVVGSTADDIAARSGIISFFNRNPVNTLGDLWKGLNTVLSAPDNAQRTAVAYGAYKRAKGLGFSEKDALDMASQAPAKVFGDFDRVSRLAQNAEIIIPYTGAIQAGARSMGRASRTKPFQTAIKDAVLITSMGGIATWSLGNNAEYYEDMIAQDKEYFLDNNWTFVMPGAQKDAEGKWSGVVHLPLTPDLRPLNRATWRSVHNLVNGESLDPVMMAGELFNMFTGDTARSVYDPQKAAKSDNKLNAVLSGSPALNLGKTLSGVNIYSGEPLVDDFTASRPRTEQVSGNTSENAIGLSKLSGGILTPQQFDQIFNLGGSTGDIIQGKEKLGVGPILKPLQPGISQTESKKSGSRFYDNLEVIGKDIKDEKTFNEFKALHTKDTGAKSLDKQAEKYKKFLAQPDLFEAEKRLDKLSREQGGTGNPLFDLTPQQQEKVMRYRGAKDLNAAKQAYDKNGNPLFTALGLDEKWYERFRDAENNFYAAIKGTDTESSPLSYSGAVKKTPSPAMQAKLDYYYTLPKGTGARSTFLKANPDILDKWAEDNQFTNAERVALGLNVIDEDSDGSGGGYGRGYGGFGGRGGGGGGGSDNVGSIYKYVINPNAGGAIAKPKISVKSAGSAKRKATAASKPKVSLRKSRV